MTVAEVVTAMTGGIVATQGRILAVAMIALETDKFLDWICKRWFPTHEVALRKRLQRTAAIFHCDSCCTCQTACQAEWKYGCLLGKHMMSACVEIILCLLFPVTHTAIIAFSPSLILRLLFFPSLILRLIIHSYCDCCVLLCSIQIIAHYSHYADNCDYCSFLDYSYYWHYLQT